jgi:ribosomal protein S18 acetylase RimI-like enzyme
MLLTIERIKSEELPLLVKICRETFYDTFHKQNTKEDMKLFLDTAFNIDVLRFELAQPFNYFYFAKLDERIVGYLQLSTAKSLEWVGEILEISRIYITKENIGLGVGKALMQFALSFGREMNKKTVYLGVWEHNTSAIHFYKKFGFEKFGEHIFMVGKDAQRDWVMKLEL